MSSIKQIILKIYQIFIHYTKNIKEKFSILEIGCLVYSFSIAFCASTGHIFVKLSRILLVLSYIYTLYKNKKFLKIKSFYITWSIISIIFAMLTLIWAISPRTVFSYLGTLLYIIIANIILYYTLYKNKKFVFNLIKSMIIGALAHGFLLYLTNGFDIYLNNRGGVTVQNANIISYICCFCFMFSIITIYFKKTKHPKLYCILSIILLIFAILSGSRKTVVYIFVFLAIVLGLYIINNKKIKNKKNIFILLIIITIIGIYAFKNIDFLYNLMGQRIETMISGLLGGKTDGSTKFRLKLINLGIGWFKERPILGYGLNCFKYLIGTTQNTWAGANGIHAHNNYIELLVNYGLVGTILYYSLYIKIIINSIKGIKNQNPYCIFTLGIIISLVIAEYGQLTYSNAFIQEIILITYFISHAIKFKISKEKQNE